MLLPFDVSCDVESNLAAAGVADAVTDACECLLFLFLQDLVSAEASHGNGPLLVEVNQFNDGSKQQCVPVDMSGAPKPSHLRQRNAAAGLGAP